MIGRRAFITLLAGGAAASPGAVWAQQGTKGRNLPTVGWLEPISKLLGGVDRL